MRAVQLPLITGGPKERRASSPRKPRIRTASVRADAGGEEQLHSDTHGPTLGGVPVRVLRLAGPGAVQARHPGRTDRRRSPGSTATPMRCPAHPRSWPTFAATGRSCIRLSLIHISEPTRLGMISYAVFCLKKKKKTN